MESSKGGVAPAFFVQRMLRNKFLLLTVVLAVTVATYFIIGLVKLLSY
jgi:hypothetical protein